MDISTFGIHINLQADITFPAGIEITAFADDADPLDLPSMAIRDKAMGSNGDLVTWSKANPLIANLAVIPGSDDDLNLQVLFEANRPGRGKRAVQDNIVITVTYPDGDQLVLIDGALTDGMPGQGASSAGRKKTKTYGFAFENVG